MNGLEHGNYIFPIGQKGKFPHYQKQEFHAGGKRIPIWLTRGRELWEGIGIESNELRVGANSKIFFVHGWV
ncbi:hypothetical protein AMTR_s00188p00042750 [Amborella trichopoda]|uniref:Uncharacterized protein n=1 Tax=Amborella trichopoda TaxID=13333 RepID=W1NKS4_AMBTC|nr:hypothetical protein AMTR_s00188p00042750 [Amborella trichopoda]